MTAPLDGIRVIEFGRIMAGPVCGMMLADLGADVIKVESLPAGDPSRRFVPPTLDGESAAFLMMNRNKRGVAVDLRQTAGREVARRLVIDADVMIENFRVGTMARLGLGYDALRAENPRLISCEISGFGRTGPDAERGGFDLTAQGYSGIMSITGEGPDRPPVKCGAPLTDVTAGILGALGVLAALIDRGRTGRGQRVDTSLFEAGITHTYWQSAIALATGVSPGPMGSAHPLSAPYEAFQTADGWINLGASSQATWERVPAVLDLPELLDDPRFRDNAGRMAHRAELARLLGRAFRTRSTSEWLEQLERAGVPAGPVLDIRDMLAHPQTLARAMVTDVHHASLGTVQTLGCPVKLEHSPISIRRGAPLLGEHSAEVLQEAGYRNDQITRLVRDGVVATASAASKKH